MKYKILDDSYPQIQANSFDGAEEKAIKMITSVDDWSEGDEFQFVLQNEEGEEKTIDYVHHN